MAKESALEKKLTAWAKDWGYLSFKFVCPAQKGVPDRIFVAPGGAVLFLEIKAPGKKPTPLQLRMIQNLRKQGVAAGWTCNLGEGILMLRDVSKYPTSFNKNWPI